MNKGPNITCTCSNKPGINQDNVRNAQKCSTRPAGGGGGVNVYHVIKTPPPDWFTWSCDQTKRSKVGFYQWSGPHSGF